MKKLRILLPALAGFLAAPSLHAISLDDIQFWAGTGTNRAAMVIHWSAPEVANETTVPLPVAEKSYAWGYRWNGTATAQNMFDALATTDHRLFLAVSTPFPFYGISPYAFGYDLNNNGVFGIRLGTNVLAEDSFTNGQFTFDTEDPDSPAPLDRGDLFWSGSLGPVWELWQEHGGAGGFTNMPDRGTNTYWTPDDPTQPYSGHQGEWDLAQSGITNLGIFNGSWIGWTVSAGGDNYTNDNDPGTIAYNLHKHAPMPAEAAVTNLPYAAQVVSSQGPFGNSPYDDPNSVLGAPATRYYASGSHPATRVKLDEGTFNVAPDQTTKLIITLNTGSAIIVRFDHPVTHNPANPYGIDFQVFGNAFYPGGGFISDTVNQNTYLLSGGGFDEPTKVSVSPGFTGQPGEDAGDPATWPWYRYDNGPYDDTDFPTQAYRWNRAGTNWTEELMDYTKPVNPTLMAKLNAGGISGADAIDLYAGSGGGTGFNLAESGFASIQYAKVEGLAGFTGGEVDAFSVVRPMTLGDTLSITPGNLTNNTALLRFQKPGAENQTLMSLNFSAISDNAQVATARLDDPVPLAAAPGIALNAVQTSLSPILGTGPVSFQADLALSAGAGYQGNGDDLHLLAWDGTNWTSRAFAFHASSNMVVMPGTTNLSDFVVAQFSPPKVVAQPAAGGFAFQFTPVANCTNILERSADLSHWSQVDMMRPTNSQPVTLQDHAAPPDKAFYRVRVATP